MAAEQRALQWSSMDVQCHELKSRDEWNDFKTKSIHQVRRDIELSRVKYPFPNKIVGFCGLCGQAQSFDISARRANVTPEGALQIQLSETVVCPKCRINSRMRFACDALSGLALKSDSPIYLTESQTHLFKIIKDQYTKLVGSEFLGPDKKAGQEYDGVTHQDLHSLSYQDQSFRAVVCLDVLEHVDKPVKVIAEIYRVLSTDGVAIVTFPFFSERRANVRRASYDENNNIQYLAEAYYHGAPGGGRSLVFHELSWDFIESLYGQYAGRVKFINYWSATRAHFGEHRFALLVGDVARVASD